MSGEGILKMWHERRGFGRGLGPSKTRRKA